MSGITTCLAPPIGGTAGPLGAVPSTACLGADAETHDKYGQIEENMKTAGGTCAKNESVACRAKAANSCMCTTRLIEHLVNETRALGLVRENVRREPNLVLACEAHSKAQLLFSRLRCASLAGALPCDAALALHTHLTIRLRLVIKKRTSQLSVSSLFPPPSPCIPISRFVFDW